MCSSLKGMACFADCTSTLPLRFAVSRDLVISALPLSRDEAELEVKRQRTESWVWSCCLCFCLHQGQLLSKAFAHPVPPLSISPSLLGHVSLYGCLLGKAVLFLRLNTLLLYRREKCNSSLHCRPLLMALAQGLCLASGTAEICFALRKIIYEALAQCSPCLRCFACQSGGAVSRQSSPKRRLVPMVLSSLC